MKRLFLYIVLIFMAVAPLKAQVEVQIGNTTSSTHGNYFPTQTYYNYSYTQQIYYQSEIGGAMSIDKIAFQYFYSTSYTRNLDIYLGHTTKGSFISGNDYLYANEMTLVYHGNVTFSNTGAGYWCEIELNTPFAYNGVDNLVIAVDDNTGEYNNSSAKFYTHTSPGNSLYSYSDGTNYNPSSLTFTLNSSTYRNNIKLISSCTCCPPALTVSDVTANSATLTWSVDEGNMATVEYRRLGDENYTAISGDGTYYFENLIPATTYEVRAKTTCPDEVSDYMTIQFTTTSVFLETIYVKPDGTGSGASWSDALNDILSASALSQLIYQDHGTYPEIWVAEGTYTGNTEAENAFVFPQGTQLYGGFAGNETLHEARNPSAHETILSGNNTQRVIYHNEYYYENQIIVDGFTIANGRAEGEYDEGFGGGVLIYNRGLNLRNCVIRNNTATRGGGLYLSNYETHVVNCKIYGNTAEEGGGVAINEGYLYNSLIYNNTATENAGGVFFQYGNIFNCDIINNNCQDASGFGGISGESDKPLDKGDRSVYDYNILNSVVWGNKADGVSSQVNENDYNMRYAYCAVEGGCTGMAILNLASANVGRGASYPKFNDPANNDFTLQEGSMLIGRGYYAVREMPDSFPLIDLAGNDRVRHGGIDIGAYESDYEKTSSIVASDEGVIFVKTDGTGDGSSWANATSDLDLALNESVYFSEKPQIWVAAGTYYGNFAMVEGVDVIGGFNGTETSARMANPETNVTILDGQQNGRVLTQSEYFETNTTWSGFTIQHGKLTQGNGAGVCLNGNVVLRDCKVINNVIVNESEYAEYRGVGVYMDGGIVTNCLIKNNIGTGLVDGGGLFVSYGEVMNCRIEGNQATYGGGCYNYGYTMINCVIVNNTATQNGGGVNDGTYINCTIAGNSVTNDSGIGGAYYGNYTNCIIWGNSNTQGLGNCSDINATYSCIEGGYSGEGNIGLSSENTGTGIVPKFVDPENGNWNLQEGSACINRGNNGADYLPENDILGNARIQNDVVDCGAYETPYDKAAFIVPGEGNIVYVKAGGSGNGSSWENATGDLKFALSDCASINPAPTIWVAEMTIDGPVKMQPNINVYGGFAGTETALEERNLAEHHTIIDGHSNGRCLYQEDEFSAETRVVWDGFVIQNGYLYGNDGAGVNIRGYADLANCEIKNCYAYTSSSYYRVYGGGVYAKNSTLTSCYIHNNYSRNTSLSSYGCGGGICAYSGVVMTNCIIANNTSSGQGSGVYFYSTENKMINCDVVNCYSQTNNNYAVYSYGGDSNYVYNTVIWGNKGNSYSASAAGGSLSHCASDVELSGTANVLLDTDNNGGTGPMFTTPSSGVGYDYSCDDANWMPKDGSALINMGDNGVEGLPTTDFAGNERIQYSTVDVGAYETPYNMVVITPSADGVIYVKQEASGTEDGSSWENATSSFAKALAVAAACETRTSVWVAEGTYGGPFTIKARTDVYGGFAGTETSIQERDWRSHLTILHGDGASTTLVQLSNFDNESDVSSWDGFVIENGGGSGYGGGAKLLKNSVLRNSIIRNNSNSYKGAAAYLSYARMENCEVYGNALSGSYGGVVYMEYSTAINCKANNNTAVYGSGIQLYYGNTLQNCLMANNTAQSYAGLYISGGDNTVIGCTIVRNKATSTSAGLRTTYSSNIITNTVSWGNMTNDVEDDIYASYSGTISYCAFTTDVSGSDNVVLDVTNPGGNGPKFVNPTTEAGVSDVAGDYSLQQGSYLINKGTIWATYWNPDLAGNERVQQGGIDIGAYESPYEYESPIAPSADNIIFVKVGGTGNGSSWENATSSLQLALNEAAVMVDKPEVWVKDDTFIGSFKMKEGVDVYGGFAGNETSLQERDLTLHSTILDGNAAGRVLLQEADFTETTVWDGFAIQNGSFSNVDEVGPAAYLMANSVLRNCDIKNNTAVPKYNYYGVKGGIVIAKGASLENCKIHDNSSTASVNCEIYYPAVNLENGSLKNCEIYDNVNRNTYATTWGDCAGVYATGSRIESCIVRNNTASGYCGGVQFYGTAESIMINSLVANNTAYSYAGVYLISNTNNVSIVNCDMVGNKNTNSSNGAGLYSGTSSTNNKLINSVVWGNKYNSSNSNLYRYYSSSLTVTNCALAGTTISDGNNINLLYDNTGTGNVPMFTHPSTEAGATCYDGDWTLQEGSILIDRGTLVDVELPEKDLAGLNRVVSATVDIGAYERPFQSVLNPDANNRLYVRNEACGLADGSSWANATNDLQLAVNEANRITPIPDVWVAEGTYTGSEETDYAYYLQAGVKVYGGFAATETELSQRDFHSHVTILDGGNVRGVLGQTTEFVDGLESVWDGFTIQHGRRTGNGAGAYLMKNGVLSYCVIKDNTCDESNRGGGVYVVKGLLINCLINNNTAYRGSGVYADNAYVVGCIIANNSNNNYSYGAVSGTTSTFVNCDIVKNTGYGVASITNSRFTNCVIWGNSYSSQLSDISTDTKMMYCAVQGGRTGTGNINLSASNSGDQPGNYPKFVDPENGNWNLQQGSILINAGISENVELPEEDIMGNPRIQNGIIDLGACESDFDDMLIVPDDNNIIYVSADGTGTGSSWADATSNWHLAVTRAACFSPKATVWVKAGTYNLASELVVAEGVNVYGGFAGTETEIGQRNMKLNPTIVAGPGDHSANRRMLMQNDAFTEETMTTWDGFTFENGYYSPSNYSSNGVVQLNSYTVLSNCIIRNMDSYITVYAGSNCALVNCLIANNTGKVYFVQNNVMLNCTYVNNGNQIESYSSSLDVVNTVIWGNRDSSGNLKTLNQTGNVYYSAIEGGCEGVGNLALTSGNDDNVAYSPGFVNPEAGDYSLKNTSVLVGRGMAEFVEEFPCDITGMARVKQGAVDMGAYESDYTPYLNIVPSDAGIIYVTVSGSGTKDGSSWVNATPHLQFAVSQAQGMSPKPQVWVAEGTYQGSNAYLNNAYQTAKGVNVYGGFAGNETSLGERNYRAHETVLDGQGQKRVLYQPQGYTLDDQIEWLHTQKRLHSG